ncbi:MAG: response regulator [Bacteroidia bacterium]|jgi:DNA-binding response OmpR family regulator
MDILIIEDDEITLTALAFKLTAKGHNVKTAGNGSKAVDMVMDNHFDLLICDLMMPIISGVTFLSIRENFMSLDTPVIVMSSLGEADEMLKKLNINFGFFVKKPIQFDTLLSLIQQIELQQHKAVS